MLEELLVVGVLDVEYDVWLVDISVGDQFLFGFVEVNFNLKIFVMVDIIIMFEIKLFELGVILQYLVMKFNMLIFIDLQEKVVCNNWLFWQMGLVLYLGGGFGYFYSYVLYLMEYLINCFIMEIKW